jgi:hypothetical protein
MFKRAPSPLAGEGGLRSRSDEGGKAYPIEPLDRADGAA